MDVSSRRMVGWAVHDRERADHAAALIHRICADSGINPHGLVLHSDNGKPMRGRTMIATLQWLGIVPSFSRPHVCNDHPTPKRCSHAHAPAVVSAAALLQRHGGQTMGRGVCWLVPRRPSSQCDSLRHPGSTPCRRGCRAPRATPPRLRARAGATAGPLVRADTQLDTHRDGGAPSEPWPPDPESATTILTLTAAKSARSAGSVPSSSPCGTTPRRMKHSTVAAALARRSATTLVL
jgi:hypothetical protein